MASLNDGNDGPLVLEGALTIREIEDLHTLVRDTFDSRQNIVVACNAATDADLSFIQLLVAGRASAQRSGKTFTLAARPEAALLATLTCAGIDIVLDGPASGPPGFWFADAAVRT